MRNHYCTLFDSKYLGRGLALYESLKKHEKSFVLYVLTMDDASEKILKRLNLANLRIIRLTDFENPQLLGAKLNRTRQEYCWTCTPALIRYCLQEFSLSECTYLDADIFFYSSPSHVLAQPQKPRVIITPHNYFPEYNQSATSGVYCVQLVTFTNSDKTRMLLEKWYLQCIEWCYARFEDNKFGDQKYLDNWPAENPHVKVCDHQGAGLAPWNTASYDIWQTKREIMIRRLDDFRKWPVIFYHFHDLTFDKNGMWMHKSGSKGYRISESVYRCVYKVYLKELFELGKKFRLWELTELPRVPYRFSVLDFETTLVGRTHSLSQIEKLRSSYVRKNNLYELISQDLQFDSGLFDIIISAGVNLGRATLWEQNGNLMNLNIKNERRKYWLGFRERAARFKGRIMHALRHMRKR